MSTTARTIGRWACCTPSEKNAGGPGIVRRDRLGGAERRFYVARPIRMTSLIACNAAARRMSPPLPVVAQCGNNGFGWKMGDVVGMQLVEVPVAGPNAQASKGLWVTVARSPPSSCCPLRSSCFCCGVTWPARSSSLTSAYAVGGLGDCRARRGQQEALERPVRDLERSIARLKTSLDEALKQIRPNRGRTRRTNELSVHRPRRRAHRA